MAETPDGRGVLLFGGGLLTLEDKIFELRAGANSWNILDITLKNGRGAHVVIPVKDYQPQPPQPWNGGRSLDSITMIHLTVIFTLSKIWI